MDALYTGNYQTAGLNYHPVISCGSPAFSQGPLPLPWFIVTINGEKKE